MTDARTGLRRFLGPPSTPTATSAVGVGSPAVAAERCELCDAAVEAGHAHVVDLAGRGLRCVCQACRLLLTRPGAARGRYRLVPDRYRYTPDFALRPDQWQQLGIPVEVAFIFRNSRLGRFVAFAPSPGGATELPLATDAWQQVLAARPGFADPADDVEALLLRHRRDRTECHLVPVSECYALVGRTRLHWQGWEGGQQVRAESAAFFAGLRARSAESVGEERSGR